MHAKEKLTIWMLESQIDLPTSLLPKRFFCIVVGELRVASHVPIVQQL
jgi:hypothetical protein